MIKIERTFGQGRYGDNGEFIAPEKQLIRIHGEIHPQGTTSQLTPEGQRVTDTIQIFTYENIVGDNESTGQKADVVIYKDKRYQVTSITDWLGDPILFHIQATAMLEAS